jgi:hypothetical protein
MGRDLQGRLRKLEGNRHGVCPGCGWDPKRVRFVEVCCYPDGREEVSPAPPPEAPPCATCGLVPGVLWRDVPAQEMTP